MSSSSLAEEVVTLSERLAAYQSTVADVVSLLGHSGDDPDDLRDAVGQIERLLAGEDQESNDLTGLAETLRLALLDRDGVTRSAPTQQVIVPVINTQSRSCYSITRLARGQWRFVRIGGWHFDRALAESVVDTLDLCPSAVFHEDWRVVLTAARDLVEMPIVAAGAA